MSAVPMCPGCRALLDLDAKLCPYCGWNIEITETRRHGGALEKWLRGPGGVTRGLIFVNVLAALWTAFIQSKAIEAVNPGAGAGDGFFGGLMGPRSVILIWLGANVPSAMVQDREWWRVMAPVFLHGGLLHIGMNMLALHRLGPMVEDAFGAGKMLALYLLAGMAGSLLRMGWWMYEGGSFGAIPSIGASGAIMGIVGMIAGLGFRIGGEHGKALWRPMLESTAFLLVIGWLLSRSNSIVQFDNLGHIGGFLFGFGIAFLVKFGVRSRSNPAVVRAWDAAAVALCFLCLASLVKGGIDASRELARLR